MAAHVRTRTRDQCRERWTCSLDPGIVRRKFSLEEDKVLYDYLRRKEEAGDTGPSKHWSGICTILMSVPYLRLRCTGVCSVFT